nr:ABC transporter ATP-binding protein/permease [Lachnospiraceae bacterium]
LGVGLFFMLVIGSFLEMLSVSVVVPYMQALLAPQNLLEQKFLGPILVGLNCTGDQQIVVVLTACIILVYFLKNLCLSFLAWVKAKYWRKVERETAISLFNSYLYRSYEFHLQTNSAQLMHNTHTDTGAVSAMLENIFNLCSAIITTVLISIFIIVLDTKMALALLVGCGFVLILVLSLFRGIIKKQGEQYIRYNILGLEYQQQAFSGIKELLINKRQPFFYQKLKTTFEKKSRATSIRNFAAETPAYVIETVCITVFIGVMAIRAYRGDMSDAFITNAAAFAVAAFRILPSIGKITSNYNSAIFYRDSLTNIYTNMKEAKEYADRLDGVEDLCIKGDFEDSILLSHVSWIYEGCEEPVLNDVSLRIKKGETIGLIGPSGAGKTTLMDLILGLFKPQQGHITIDDVDIQKIPKQWSELVGYIPQNVFLTDDSIRNNVAFGINSADIEDAKIWKALEQAQLRTYVESLPDQLDTVVGENGMRISGGQRQRIAIARALYNDPPILFMDEATSALDSETESAVMDAIEKLHGDKTMIIVAHRLSTLKGCDKIYKVSDQQVKEADKTIVLEAK